MYTEKVSHFFSHVILSQHLFMQSWALDTNDEERAKGKTVECGRATFHTEKKVFCAFLILWISLMTICESRGFHVLFGIHSYLHLLLRSFPILDSNIHNTALYNH